MFQVDLGLVGKCSGLRSVTLRDVTCCVDLTPLSQLVKLEMIDIYGMTRSTPSAEGTLKRCASLTSLNLHKFTTIRSDVLEGLAVLPRLTSISLQFVPKLKSIRELRKCPALRWIACCHTGLTDDGIRGVEKLPMLEHLDLTGCSGVRCVDRLQRANFLSEVFLSATSVPNAEATASSIRDSIAIRNLRVL